MNGDNFWNSEFFGRWFLSYIQDVVAEELGLSFLDEPRICRTNAILAVVREFSCVQQAAFWRFDRNEQRK